MDSLDLLNNDLQVTPLSQNLLSEAAKWGKFLSIVGFIFCGFLAIAAFFMPAVYARLSALSQLPPSVIGAAATTITIVYLIFAVLLFLPCLYLNKFSNKMKVALTVVSQESFEDSFKNLKSLLKFYGIFTIIILSFYVLAFVIGALVAAMR
jgi:hypothetical protein